jgi:hypothetical protein
MISDDDGGDENFLFCIVEQNKYQLYFSKYSHLYSKTYIL